MNHEHEIKVKKEEGSFLHLLFFFAFLSLLLLLGMFIISKSLQNNLLLDYELIATALAQEKMEEVVSHKAYYGFEYITPEIYPEEDFSEDFSMFQRMVSIENVKSENFSRASSDSGYKKVTVMVSWGGDKKQSVSFSTLLTRY
ncbi:MAG: hypothetical protein COX62_09155 [Deltaproteobacteria bacterium CG_4_10_14_0_2_um_filter_43_8]|nr:MAG: hypothetical protein COV43_00140 [Deltaproteobacteria bacterium CG11_big_fil_rev_8_21_14_0_20_42_23]PJA18154.1 MAG: hypothetical protein COX62_09155 [Deltaproteobacteria bacterium CG_4_10_14_0_2_um_filter_43_8]PJC64265.1 MAG: hypothetical protein CO021_04480 [Deltaproteobacteria bacterium CG_4_9_14_0_2_um_filter_42_21]